MLIVIEDVPYFMTEEANSMMSPLLADDVKFIEPTWAVTKLFVSSLYMKNIAVSSSQIASYDPRRGTLMGDQNLQA